MPAVDLFIPCFVDQLFPQTAMNMVKVLEAVGCEVHYNGNQTCCGQPAYNAGYKAESCQVATKFLNDFPNGPGRYIVSPSASCVGMVRGTYAELFEDTKDQSRYQGLQRRIFEMTEFLVDVLGITQIEGAQLAGKYTYHDSCAALRECGIREAPRTLLDSVLGLERLEMAETETCCGFGGTFAVKFEAISVAMAEQKVEHALATGADYLVSTDTSCLMHLDAYIRRHDKPIRTLHVADVLASGW
ncbi:(Fe-S)-binding protein [Hymenobacter cavernae]|uniref:Fe-S oxidoreductase n=1 Tax=Hymenobacter cavernae TaxID=2044852 RepID=A0ABQ1U667_9BACT|nr:(Fe-S)-binding protein [Hymenobacter cavernae]GGF09902.1 Fe-S oxidoreductase [Hymenobacter cavernae]